MYDKSTDHESTLPNFGNALCAVRVLVVAQIVALIVWLSRTERLDLMAWQDLLTVTAFSQVIAITGILMLSVSGDHLRLFPKNKSIAVATGIMTFAAIVVTGALLFGLDKLDVSAGRWPTGHLALILKNALIAAAASFFVFRYSAASHRAEEEAKSKQSERLQALQSRIRPHFLFNSMNSVAGLIRLDPELAERALTDLADVFRVLLADARKMVPITAEGELARQYLNIEKIRLGDRLQVKWTASNVPRSAQIPSLTLQPLLENAVYHGIEPSFAGGTIDVQLWCEDNMLNVMITNPVPEIGSPGRGKGNKIALDNVRERLFRHYGGEANMRNFEQFGSYHVKLRMPIVRG